MNFPCVRCGLCCRILATVPKLSCLDDGNGVCRYLKNDLCSIYKKRPLVCNSEKVYVTFYKDHMSERTFVRKVLAVCHDLILKSGNEQNLEKIEAAIRDLELEEISEGDNGNGENFKK
jgi:Fe-S-cluster containining protein